MSTDGTGVWAYAIFPDDSGDERVAGLVGVAGEPVRVISGAGLAAAVGTVGLDEFGEEALRRNLENLDWLGVKARAHDAVVSTLARSGPVIPVRMTTVYLTDQRVRRMLENGRTVFRAALDRVTGRVELGVKAYADPKALVAEDDPVQDPGGRGSGAAYLLRRKRQLHSQERAHGIAAAAAERFHRALLAGATDGKRKPVADNSLSGRSGWTVLNGTYLVDVDRVDEFRSTVTSLQSDSDGIELEITGPWPPYSFTADVVSADE